MLPVLLYVPGTVEEHDVPAVLQVEPHAEYQHRHDARSAILSKYT